MSTTKNSEKLRRRLLGVVVTFATAETRRILISVGVVLVAATGVGALVSSALLTDSDTVTGNTFNASAVSLSLDKSSALVSFTSPAMVPGDKITSPLLVTNDGTASLRYSMTSVTDATDANRLAAQLLLRVRSGVTTCTSAGFDVDGTDVYGTSVSTTNILGSNPGGVNVIGNPSVGQQSGDRVLPPTSSNSETLCFQVSMPSSVTTPAYSTTTAVFTFNSEQTLNNP